MSKILIVDDDFTITELMKALVSMEGHEAITVNNSLSAVETAKSIKPDLITLDLMMPDLTGFELCKLLSDDPEFSNTPIVIISAKDDPESRRLAMEAGAKDYVTKPFNIDEFMATVASLTKI
jgi:DNA-binding response OmpR family regulator